MSQVRTTLTLFVILSSLCASLSSAQTTYQWTDPATGGTIISDKAPPPGAKDVIKWSGNTRAAEQQVPYATRQAAEKFPVTLYTQASCVEACKQARDLLNGRGVPFSERMVKTNEEIAELAKILGGEASVPSLVVGQQNVKGLESGAWNNLLDLAGYPKSAPFGAKPSGAFSE